MRAEIVREMTALVLDAFGGQLRYSHAVEWWLDDGHPYAVNDREMLRSGVVGAVVVARDRLANAEQYGSPRWSVIRTNSTHNAVMKELRLAALSKARPQRVVHDLGWSPEDEHARYGVAANRLSEGR